MARRNTLIPAAVAGTLTLWAATIATAVTEFGSDRLHETLRSGSVMAVLATLALAGGVLIRRQVVLIRADLRDQAELNRADLRDTVHQAADELHAAVDVQGKTLNRDRIAAVRTLATQLRRVRGDGRDDQVA